MTSIVEICNSALNKIGANTINSLTENSQEARLCAAQFPRIRDVLLRSHPWNFATIRLALPRLVNPPAFEFAYAYQLPSDCLRVLQLSDPTTMFRIESGRLLTNASRVKLIYVRRETDPSHFDAQFSESLATHLAAEIAFAISNNRSLAGELSKLAKNTLLEAKTCNAQEGTPGLITYESWINARL